MHLVVWNQIKLPELEDIPLHTLSLKRGTEWRTRSYALDLMLDA